MKRRAFIRTLILLTCATAGAVTSSSALARRGRPASPNSVAGVRRRTRRRTRRRIRRVHRHMTLYSLPYGCSAIRHRSGVKYYYCGGIWYRPAYQSTTIVYIVEDIEPGAQTELEFDD